MCITYPVCVLLIVIGFKCVLSTVLWYVWLTIWPGFTLLSEIPNEAFTEQMARGTSQIPSHSQGPSLAPEFYPILS